MIEEARALYAADPTGFVSERLKLAQLLKAAVRVDDASVLAALHRPKLREYSQPQTRSGRIDEQPRGVPTRQVLPGRCYQA